MIGLMRLFYRPLRILLFIAVLSVGVVLAVEQPASDHSNSLQPIGLIQLKTSINPGSADFIKWAMDSAKAKRCSMLIIELDTPGGLVESTRSIVQSMLGSDLPIVVYVSPPGARAGSAGVMITMAAHVAAMAPSTNIGAAHPVSGTGEMDKTMESKVTNDTVAFAVGIAEKRGRNKEWAEKAVRESASITATEALRLKVIDFIADDTNELIRKLDGRKVAVSTGEIKISTVGASTITFKPSLKHKLIIAIADPNIAYLLMIIGMLGIYAEFSHPGLILPGVTGGICLVLFLMSVQILPINYVGLLLIILGIVLLILEIKISSFGLLAVGGVACMGIGSLFLFDVPEKIVNYPDFNLRVSLSVLIPSVIALAGCILFITYLVIRTHRRKIVSGEEGMVGEIGVATTDLSPDGKVKVQGIYWQATAEGENIEASAKIEVVRAKNLHLFVKKVESKGSR